MERKRMHKRTNTGAYCTMSWLVRNLGLTDFGAHQEVWPWHCVQGLGWSLMKSNVKGQASSYQEGVATHSQKQNNRQSQTGTPKTSTSALMHKLSIVYRYTYD